VEIVTRFLAKSRKQMTEAGVTITDKEVVQGEELLGHLVLWKGYRMVMMPV
jgi:hypothetical protein